MKKQAPSPSGIVHQTKRILDALEKAVAELPLEDMIADTQLANGASPRSFDTMTENANDIVRLLAIEASLGDVTAVRDLRYLGMLVIEILMSLAKIGEENSESKGDDIYRLRDHLTKFYRNDAPIITISGDFSGVHNILEQESDSISKLPLESIRDWVDSHASMDTMNQMTISAPGLFSPKRTIESNITSATSEDVIEYKDFHQELFKKMDLMVGRLKMSQDFHESLTTSKEAIHEIILRMMASRLSDFVQKCAGPTVSRVASESPTWPVLASALEYVQPELDSLLDSMGFGTNLPFRIRRKGKSGAPRSFKPGTQAAFALAVCLDIESTRKAYQYSTKEELDALRMKVSQIERDRANRPPYKLGPPNPDNGGQRMGFRDGLWAFKAALLPPFPLNSEKSSASKNSFEEWHKVAMLRAETLCFSDWENYPWWPSCVMNRAGWDETTKRHRTVFEAVSEKLRAGMKKLQPDTSASLRP